MKIGPYSFRETYVKIEWKHGVVLRGPLLSFYKTTKMDIRKEVSNMFKDKACI